MRYYRAKMHSNVQGGGFKSVMEWVLLWPSWSWSSIISHTMERLSRERLGREISWFWWTRSNNHTRMKVEWYLQTLPKVADSSVKLHSRPAKIIRLNQCMVGMDGNLRHFLRNKGWENTCHSRNPPIHWTQRGWMVPLMWLISVNATNSFFVG